MPKWLKWILDTSGAGIVGAAAWAFVTTAGPTLIAFIRGVRGPWIYVGLGATGGILLVIVFSLAIAAAKYVRARSAAKKAATAIVGKKGWVDHKIEWMEAQEEYLARLGELTVEIQKIGEVYSENKRDVEAAAQRIPSDNLQQRARMVHKL